MERRGRVILLNGVSSSGKTSLGQAMLPLLADPWFLFPVDALGALRSPVHTGDLRDDQVHDVLRRTRRGYHRAVAALASVGNDVVMDYPLSEPWRLQDLLAVLRSYDVTLVEVWCDADELARRERERGDRPIGLAASQAGVYDHGHDLRVDTTHTGPADCARQVVDALPGIPRPTLFERLGG